MSIELKVYDNGDHTCLVWLPSDRQPVKDCRGYAIERTRNGEAPTYLHGFVGFSDDDKLDEKNPWKFPLQRFLWWDYDVKPGDAVSYRIVPVIGKDKNSIQPNQQLASASTPVLHVTGQCSPHISAYFNKGIVAAQWVSRALDEQPKGANVKNLVQTVGNPLRNALSGLLRPEIISLLEDAKKNSGKIFASLYELNDVELIGELVKFGKDCNLILANGAFKPPDNDENKAIRAKLKTQVRVYDRLVTSGHFAHNKFVVICDRDGKPLKVLTGSTNWTFTGLCTQANNALIIDDAAVAQNFREAWDRYHVAGNGYPTTLAAANSTAKTFDVDGCKVTPWFVPTRHAEDLDYARKLINGAKHGILFLFFNPGTFQPEDKPERWTLLQNVLNRHHEENNAYYNPDLYIKGVVNQEIPLLTNNNPPTKGKKPPAGSLDPTVPAHSVALYTNGLVAPQRLTHDLMVPGNIKTNFAHWIPELLGAGVHVHSKVIVIDPFGENPVVMTGSHNLGFKASSKNDDNLVIIEGNAPLAVAYAVNIIAIFQAYRWNHHVEEHRQDPKVWHGLQDTDTWQQGYLKPGSEHLAELEFWLGKEEEGQAAVAAAAAHTGAVGGVPLAPYAATGRQWHRVNTVSTRKPPEVHTGKPSATVQSITEHEPTRSEKNGRSKRHSGKKASGE
jgi:phosphatidylserine/phosphatidylglycerophosphate/cardiolipin synthase-like enzyme